jgi:peptidoglycan/xylan/chitin deacetylase (PgdA/CDA1 family)
MTVVVDLSLATATEGLRPSDLRGYRATFALHDGLHEILRSLDEAGVRATFTVPAAMIGALGSTLTDVLSAGHELAAHGLKHEDVSTLTRDEEQRRMQAAFELFDARLGISPSGWFSLPRQSDPFAVGTVSEHTIDLLIDSGVRYMGNGLADDIPHYWVAEFDNRRSLLTLPYYYHFDDQFFLMFPTRGTGLEHADALFANWEAELRAQYKRGRQFSMTLHPFAVGFAHRSALLRDFFALTQGIPDIWNPTCEQLADYWLEHYPAADWLRLEASTWQDHDDSLS